MERNKKRYTFATGICSISTLARLPHYIINAVAEAPFCDAIARNSPFRKFAAYSHSSACGVSPSDRAVLFKFDNLLWQSRAASSAFNDLNNTFDDQHRHIDTSSIIVSKHFV